MLGIQIGATVHIAFAAVGLSAILGVFRDSFLGGEVARGGVPDLVGDQHDCSPATRQKPPQTSRENGPGNVFWQGVLVNVLNPKTALFFLAFLPQFVVPSRKAQPGRRCWY